MLIDDRQVDISYASQFIPGEPRNLSTSPQTSDNNKHASVVEAVSYSLGIHSLVSTTQGNAVDYWIIVYGLGNEM